MWKSMLSPKQISPTQATMMIVVSVIGFALVPLFGKTLSNAGLASSAIAFYRYALAGLLLLPALRLTSEKRVAIFWAMGVGFAMALGWITYFEALKTVPVATMGVIYMTYPLFTLLIATLWLRQVPSLRSILAGLLIVVAAFIALSPTSVGTDSFQALLLSFFNPLTLGLSLIIIADKLTDLSALEKTCLMAGGGALGLLPLILSLESSVLIPSRSADWMLILGISILTLLLPSFFYVIAIPIAGSTRSAIVGGIELPIVFVIGWLAFGEEITLLQSVAGVLVISAIWMTSVKPSENLDVSEEVEVEKMMPPTSVKTSVERIKSEA